LIGTSGEITFTTEDWQAFVVSGLVSLILIAVMFSMGLFISVLVRNSSTALMSLLAIWVLLALIIPNAGPYIAEVVATIPAPGAVERPISERIKEVNDQFRQAWGGGGRGRGGRRGMREMSTEQRAELF
jgi:ABC-type transport system involved in multi-copper enzyme maturation permease subunit